MTTNQQDQPAVFVRTEDMDHPKLPKLARMVALHPGEEGKLREVWIAWGAGLTREWLLPRIEGKGHVLILPPWPSAGFAGLPAARLVQPPGSTLVLEKKVYHVAASQGMEEDNAWKAEGYFSSSRIAWLVSHEPYAGAGKAWLCTAELLLANPNSRPKDVRALTRHIIQCLGDAVGSTVHTKRPVKVTPDAASVFLAGDAPYLLALLDLKQPVEPEKLVQTVMERFMIAGDIETAERLLSMTDIRKWMQMPLEQRDELFQVIDRLGFRSYRLELMEATT